MSPLATQTKNNLSPSTSRNSMITRPYASDFTFDRFFEEFFGPPLMPSTLIKNNYSRIRSTYEEGGKVSVVIDALGVDPKDVSIRISKDMLSVSYNNETYQHRLPCEIVRESVQSEAKFGQIFLSMKSKEAEEAFVVQLE